MSSPYNTHSWSSASDVTPSSSRHWIIPRLCPCEDSALAVDPLPPPSSTVPLASLVTHSPLEPLFLGMDDNAVITPLPSPYLVPLIPNPVRNDPSLVSPAIDLYEVDSQRAVPEMTTPECQAVWEAELARSPTPPPAADEVIDTVLLAPQAGTPVYRLVVQPLTPPPRWVARQTPPPPDRHLPSNGEIAGWSEQFVMAELLTRVTDHYYPPDWDVPVDSLPAKCLHPALHLHSPARLVEWAHLTVVDGYGPGLVWSEERTSDLVWSRGWVTAMQVIWHLHNQELVSSLLHTLQLYVECHDRIYSKRQPHESVAESGGPPDPINSWVTPTVEELVIWSSLVPPPAPSSYVDM
ncbi:hypothetical protein NDA13_006491 [Ustilago tritici]|nr:hypothetical protein NDA13_006485 [Ustilago tritici]KAJ1018177.1 hypothetical protein NDA13_006487 [Ustilago tritici]KAJ1018179.1 hypothetical protein NDA13_006489 [Ustilago tritici]KAJ1018181.1 hypothetical protein NDA13_006491 [Ustilago tritici]